MNISNDRLAELIDMMPRNAEWQAEVVAALRELSRLRGPTPTVDAAVKRIDDLNDFFDLPELYDLARTLERELRAYAKDAERLKEVVREAYELLQEFYKWDNHGYLTKSAMQLRERTSVFLHGHPPCADAALKERT